MRNAVRAILAATTVAAGALASLSPAAADPTPATRSCENGFFCIWQHSDFEGIKLPFNKPITRVDIRGGSVENQDDVDWCIYAGKNYTGEYRRIMVERRVGSLTDPNWNFPRVRSLRPCADQ